ncbi:MAG TPA: hypothetical protein VFP84_16540, partial [Kofleriaceae bacterium]|nr:hypothetical protein [Kofleriaceae bacterium]
GEGALGALVSAATRRRRRGFARAPPNRLGHPAQARDLLAGAAVNASTSALAFSLVPAARRR